MFDFDPDLLESAPLAIYSCFASSVWKKFADTYTYPTTIGYDTSLVLCLIQTLICFIIVGILRVTGLIPYGCLPKREFPKWMWISFFFFIKTYTSDVASLYISSPVYSIFEKATIIIIAIGELYLFGNQITKVSVLAFSLMLSSPLVLHYQEMFLPITGFQGVYASRPIGLLWMTISCFSSIGFYLSLRRRIVITKIRDFDTVFYFSFVTAPFLLLGSVILDRWTTARFETGFVPGAEVHSMFSIFLSGISSLWTLYGTVWCIRTTTSTAYLVVMALSALPRMAIETVFTQGEYLDCWGITSAIALLLAGLVFVWDRMNITEEMELGDDESGDELIELKV